LLSPNLGLLSLVAVVPVITGMVAGEKIRERLPEAVFRNVFFVFLPGLGVYVVASAMLLIS